MLTNVNLVEMPGWSHYHPTPAISISTLVSFARCPRKFFYSFGCEIGTEEHIALKFGEAIHAALGDAFFGRLDDALAKFDKVWEDRPGDDITHNRVAAFKMLSTFASQHAGTRSIYTLLPPPLSALKIADKISDYEIPFAIDLGLAVPFVGRIDGLCKHRDTGELWALEFKTCSEMSTRFFDGFTINPQTIGYVLALRSGGINARGAIVEGIKKIKTASGKGAESDTMSQPIFVTDSMIEDFISWARWIGSQILACEQYKFFPKDISACAPYSQFGMPGYQCEFTPLCLMKDWTVGKASYTHRSYPTFELLKPTLNGEILPSSTTSNPKEPPDGQVK